MCTSPSDPQYTLLSPVLSNHVKRTVTILITRVKNYRFVDESYRASIDTRRESCSRRATATQSPLSNDILFISMFDLKQLQCFVAVGEELHFGRAAKRMYMTQPPLSRHIQLLEHELQIQLLVRTNRSVKLTLAGSAFLKEARQLLALAENAASSAQRIAAGKSGLLNLGFTGGSSYSFLPRMLASTNASLNNIDIVLHEMMTRNLVEALHAHAMDISLLRLTSPPNDLEFACVAREPLMLAVPSGHRLATGRMPTLKDIAAEPFITFHPIDGDISTS